jgi:hypothetical protein
MEADLYLDMRRQPDETSCGPTCLHAVYRYFGDHLPLNRIIEEVPEIEGGGTLAVLLACHALQRGYHAAIYSYNLQIFDPTWSHLAPPLLAAKLKQQAAIKQTLPGFEMATEAYLKFLQLGGRLSFEVLSPALVRRPLKRSLPVLCGLSATYLYNSARECFVGRQAFPDDVRGETQGHFVVLAGYDRAERSVKVADPYLPNPVAEGQYYHVKIDRLLCAILLGILTYDGDLLIISPRKRRGQGAG